MDVASASLPIIRHGELSFGRRRCRPRPNYATCCWFAAGAVTCAAAAPPCPQPALHVPSLIGSPCLLCVPQTLLFFAGFLLRFDDIPNYWKWYSYIDVLR